MELKNDSTDSVRIFQDSVGIVERLGSTKIKAVSLKDCLKFNGVSLWDIVAPHQAAYVLPRVISREIRRPKIKQFFQGAVKPCLRYLRRKLKELTEKEEAHLLTAFGNKKARKIVFLSFEPRQSLAFLPVMELLSDSSFQIKIIGTKYQPIKEEFFGNNREFIAIEDFFTKQIRTGIVKKRKQLRALFSVFKKERTLKNALGPYRAILNSWIKYIFLDLFLNIFPSLIKQLEVADLILERERPDIIVGADDCDERARVYFLLAKKRKIPTLHIQFGLAAEDTVNWKFISTDKAAIFDRSTYQTLVEMGVAKEKLFITGNPRFDRLSGSQQTKNKICSLFGINPENRLVLFTSQPYVIDEFPNKKYKKEITANLYRSLSAINNVCLVVKPHPDEDMKFHRSLSSKFSSIFLAEKNANVQDLILACDVMITFNSTTILEALIAEKYIICLDPGKGFQFNNFVKNGVALGVSLPEKIEETINNIFTNEGLRKQLARNRENFFKRTSYNIDGKSSERIVDLMLQMIKIKNEV